MNRMLQLMGRKKFQSTLSVWRATKLSSPLLEKWDIISIHALRVESDLAERLHM